MSETKKIDGREVTIGKNANGTAEQIIIKDFFSKEELEEFNNRFISEALGKFLRSCGDNTQSKFGKMRNFIVDSSQMLLNSGNSYGTGVIEFFKLGGAVTLNLTSNKCILTNSNGEHIKVELTTANPQKALEHLNRIATDPKP